MTEPMRSVQLPAELCAAVEQKYGPKHGSLDAFLTFMMRELMSDDALRMDEEEQRVVEQRLRDLGYM